MQRVGKTIFRAATGLFLLGCVFVFADVPALLSVLQDTQIFWLFFGGGIAISSNVLSALRWKAVANFLGCTLSYRQALRWYFQGMGVNALLPGSVVGGDLYRVFALRRGAQPSTEAAWSVLFDRLSGLWMLFFVGAVGAALSAFPLSNATGLPHQWIATVSVVSGLVLLLSPMLIPWLLRRNYAMDWKCLIPLRSASTHSAFVRQLRIQALSSLGVQLLSAAALAAGGQALGLSLGGATWAFAIAPIFLMAALPVSIGGWGTREAAAILALAPFGVSPAAAVGVALIYGVYGLAQALLGALAFGLPSAEPSLQVSKVS